MATATEPTTTQPQADERLLALQPEPNEENGHLHSGQPAKSAVVFNGKHLPGMIAHSFVSFHDWISGPPTTGRQRTKASLERSKNEHRLHNMIL